MANSLTEKDIKKLYEDEDILVVQALSWKGVLYYGRNTHLGEDSEGYFPKRDIIDALKTGEIFFIVDKKTGKKNVIERPWVDDIMIDDEQWGDLEQASEEFSYLKLKNKKVFKELFGNKFFFLLRKFLKKEIDKNTLLNSSSSSLINRIIVDSEKLMDSFIYLEREEDDGFLDWIGLTEDELWFYKVIQSSNFEFIDSYRFEDSYNSFLGQLYDDLDKENKETLNQIGKILIPTEKVDFSYEKYVQRVEKIIKDNFPHSYNHIMNDYINEVDDLANQIALNDTNHQLKVFFEQLGFVYENTDLLVTTPRNLLEIYSLVGTPYSSLEETIKKFFESSYSLKGVVEPSWEDYYVYENDAIKELNWEYMNSKIGNELDELLEKITYDNNYQEYFKLVDTLKEKFEFDKSYPTSYDKNIEFKILDVDLVSKKIKVYIRNNQIGKSKLHYFSEENFYKFVNNPELFSIFDEN